VDIYTVVGVLASKVNPSRSSKGTREHHCGIKTPKTSSQNRVRRETRPVFKKRKF